MREARGVHAEIRCHDCGALLALRWEGGGLYVIVHGSEWSDGRVTITCPDCHRRIRIRLTPTEREAA